VEIIAFIWLVMSSIGIVALLMSVQEVHASRGDDM
jgi:hypothetical protein